MAYTGWLIQGGLYRVAYTGWLILGWPYTHPYTGGLYRVAYTGWLIHGGLYRVETVVVIPFRGPSPFSHVLAH